MWTYKQVHENNRQNPCEPIDLPPKVGQAGIWQTLCAVFLSFSAAFCTTAAAWKKQKTSYRQKPVDFQQETHTN